MKDEEIRDLISRPGGYLLSDGITATTGGLIFSGASVFGLKFAGYWNDEGEWITSWLEAAERLRYREGEPWCHVFTDEDGYDDIICRIMEPWPSTYRYGLLHRLAAILCDDADAFRVLWWCVHNFGGES